MYTQHPEILSLLYMILNHTLKFNTFITREIEEIQQAQLNIGNKLDFQQVSAQRRQADTRAQLEHYVQQNRTYDKTQEYLSNFENRIKNLIKLLRQPTQ